MSGFVWVWGDRYSIFFEPVRAFTLDGEVAVRADAADWPHAPAWMHHLQQIRDCGADVPLNSAFDLNTEEFENQDETDELGNRIVRHLFGDGRLYRLTYEDAVHAISREFDRLVGLRQRVIDRIRAEQAKALDRQRRKENADDQAPEDR